MNVFFLFLLLVRKNVVYCDFDFFVKLYYFFACSFRILVVSLLLLRDYDVICCSLDGKENVLAVFDFVAVL